MSGRPSTGVAGPRAAVAGHGGGFGTGWTKLLGSRYGPEIGWLYPLAILALVFGLIRTRRAERSDRVRGGFVMWGVWLLTFGLIFSDMAQIPHTAYMASLAPALAALSAAGIVMFWREYQAGGRRALMLPVAVATEMAWVLFLWRDYDGFLPWARAAAVVVGVAAVIVLVAAKPSGPRARLVWPALIAGVAAMLAAPASWAVSVLDVTYAGSSFDAGAGPVGEGPIGAGAVSAGPGGGQGGGASRFSGAMLAALAERLGIRAPGGDSAGGAKGRARPGAFGTWMTAVATTLDSSERRIDDYVSAHRDGADYLMAVSSWGEASPYILATGQEIMPMGGFSGLVAEPTLAQVRELVSGGRLRFFLLDGAAPSGTAAEIIPWVERACAPVAAKEYGAGSGPGTLYECAPRDRRHRAVSGREEGASTGGGRRGAR